MKKKKKTGSLGGLYVMIALCLVCSAVAVFGLMGKLEGYQESNDSYASLQQAALTILPEEGAQQAAGGADQSAADEVGDPDSGPLRTISPEELAAARADASTGEGGVEAVPVIDPHGQVVETVSQGPEEENVVDEALIWMLKNQTEDELITDLPGALYTPAPQQQTVQATVSNAPQDAGEASEPSGADEVQTQESTYLVSASTGTAPAVGNDKQLSGKADYLQVTPAPTATPTPAPTLDSATSTPAPTATVPPYVPSSGISMERAVTVTSARYAVNFDYLTLVNDDVVGWLYQEGTAINYPVMRGNDNEYYLNHLFDKTVNSAGSVFMDSGNSAAFIDSATYLYGHHSKGGGMFASLSEYLDPAYYEAHPQFLLITPFADYQVDVFAGMATVVEDEESWRPKTLETEQDMNEFLELILSQSFIQAPEDKLPLWGDRLLVLVTCTNIRNNQRYVIYGRMRPIVYETDEESVVATKVEMDEKPTQNGYVTIEGVGTFMNYAQNDELWQYMKYESKGSQKRRSFGDGGCSPTAVAIAIANLCEVEELPRMIGYANTELGYTFCTCSVNRYYCDHTHAQYQLRTGEEFLRYMPLAVANFATGNNIWDIKSRGNNAGTSMRYLEKICALYGIRVSVIEDAEELMRRMEEEKVDGIKRMAISCAVRGSPFTKSGHFVVICGLDEEYVYFLDPLRRDSYEEYDRFGYAEILQPGVCRIARENAGNCNLIPFYLLEKVQ